MKEILQKLREDPAGFVKRGIYKTFIGPLIYKRYGGYDADNYWRRRLSKYGRSMVGPGDEGLSEESNRKMYQQAAETFLKLCERENVKFTDARVLEIGCGNGFYTHLLHSLGVKNYTGIDITDVLFPDLMSRFPDYSFLKKDVTRDRIRGPFDLIVIIDVVEHIVVDEKLTYAMENLKACLAEDGKIVLAPVMNVGEKKFFYLRFWSLKDIEKRFSGYIFSEQIPFRRGFIITIKKTG